jgi:hypothetical protein
MAFALIETPPRTNGAIKPTARKMNPHAFSILRIREYVNTSNQQ